MIVRLNPADKIPKIPFAQKETESVERQIVQIFHFICDRLCATRCVRSHGIPQSVLGAKLPFLIYNSARDLDARITSGDPIWTSEPSQAPPRPPARQPARRTVMMVEAT